MEIKVEVVRENEDGSADALVHFDKEGLGFLVQEGILAILKQYIKQCKKETKNKRKKKDEAKDARS
jgi:hypothetical protein